MLVSLRALNRRHLATPQCTKGTERKQRKMEEEELRESSERSFQDYGEPLETVTSFKYLGRVLTAGDDNWTEVAVNLRKLRKSWVQMTRILSQEGADLKVSGNFFKVVVQVVLIFVAETWVLTPRMERALSSFQHRVARRLTRRQTRRRGGGEFGYILRWKRQWRKWASRRLESMSQGGKIRSRNKLQRN